MVILVLPTGCLLLHFFVFSEHILQKWIPVKPHSAGCCCLSEQILYDYNNSSWYEVWENRLKVSRGTDGPAGLFWWVTMVMWI